MLLQVADDFIENIINTSCQLAKHRKSNILEAKDVQFHLGKIYSISFNQIVKKQKFYTRVPKSIFLPNNKHMPIPSDKDEHMLNF